MFSAKKMISHDSKAFGHTNITVHFLLFTCTIHFKLCLFKGGCPLSFSSGLLL